jgi:hypothetical protein
MNVSWLIERAMRAMLPMYLGAILLSTFIGAVLGYRAHDGWRMGDWLINYSGGFVRRGLFGQVFLSLSDVSSINPGVFAAISQCFFYAVFFLFSYLLLRKAPLLKYALLIVSPFVFTFQLNDLEGGYRKEIIYFAALSFLAWAKVHLGRKSLDTIFPLLLLACVPAVLGHEMLVFFVPYLYAIYFHGNEPDRARFGVAALCTVPLLLALLFSVLYAGSPEKVRAIFDSLASRGYPVKDGAINWLSFTSKEAAQSLLELLPVYPPYLLALGLSLLAFVPVYPNLRHLAQDKGVLLPVLLAFAGTVLISAVAVDWGRFIYINLVSLFILCLVAESGMKAEHPGRLWQRWPVLCLALGLVWAGTFRIPRCCGDDVLPHSLREVNFFNYIQPPLLMYRQLKLPA